MDSSGFHGPPAPAPTPAPSQGAPAPNPTDLLDIVSVSVILIGSTAMLAGSIVIMWFRNYRPIKTKSVPLTLLSSLGGLITIVATLVVNDHFALRHHSLLGICALWTYWLQACFGFALWLNCLTLRLISLYRIFICKVNSRKFDYLLLLPLMLPTVAYSIIATAIRSIEFKSGAHSEAGYCQFVDKKVWASGLIVLLLINFVIFIWFAFRLRNTMAQFNEFRLIRRGGVLSLFLFLLSMVTLKTDTYVQSVGRCFLSAAVASAVFYYFWARNGVVIYNVLFHRSAYLDKFNADLRRLPSELESERLGSSASFARMENQLKSIREEVEEYKSRIVQLEQEITTLELHEKTLVLLSTDSDAIAKDASHH